MQKNIPISTLNLLRNLISNNDYQLPNNPPLSVVDLILDSLIWNHDTEELADLLAQGGQFDEAANILRALGNWRLPCRVRKVTLAPNTSISLGTYNDNGATVQLADDNFPKNYWIIVIADNPPMSPPHLAIDLTQDLNQPLYGISRWIFTNESNIKQEAISLFTELESATQTVSVVQTSFVPGSGMVLGPYPNGATIYVGFPQQGVLNYPDWYLANNFQEVQNVDIVDQALKIGGTIGGVSARLQSGGSQSHFLLPRFAKPLLEDVKFNFNVPSSLGHFFNVTFIANISNLLWNPASNQGTLEIRYSEQNSIPAVTLELDFDTSQTDEIVVIDGPDQDITAFSITISLLIDVREGRLHWVPQIDSNVTLSSNDSEAQDKIEKVIERTLFGILKPHLVEQIGIWLFSLPLLRQEPPNWTGSTSFSDSVMNKANALLVAISLFDPLDINPNEIIRNPDYPTSMLPSSLRSTIFDNSQRMLDRFVSYNSASLESDLNGTPTNLLVDYDLFSAHANGASNHPFTHEVIPRETFRIRPLLIHPNSETIVKWSILWQKYVKNTLLDLASKLLPAGRYGWAQNYLPRLIFEYEIEVQHDALPNGSMIWQKRDTHLLAGIGINNDVEYYFNESVLRPASFEEGIHYLEMPSVLESDIGDIIHNASFSISGGATLEYWVPKELPGGCTAVFQSILRRMTSTRRLQEAQQEAQSGGISEEPYAQAISQGEIIDKYKKITEFLGHFAGPGTNNNPGFDMSDGSGMATNSGNGNEFIVTGNMLDVKFLLERQSVDPDIFDHIDAFFKNFKLNVNLKDPDVIKNALDVLSDFKPFEVVAFLQGDEIARSQYKLDSSAQFVSGTPIELSKWIPLSGNQWNRQLYFPKDTEDNFFITARVEIQRQGQVISNIESSWSRFDSGSSWSKQTEFGIPTGHARVVRTISNDTNSFSASIQLMNQLPDLAKTDIIHQPKKLKISFEEIDVVNDSDPIASGELQYKVFVERKMPGEDLFALLDERLTAVLELNTGDKSDPKIEPVEATFKPEDELRLLVKGKEIDNPGWFDPNDHLISSFTILPITFNDDQDGEIIIQSPDYNFTTRISTISKPPMPELKVFNTNSWVETWQIQSTSLVDVILRIRSSWLETLELHLYNGAGNSIEEQPFSKVVLPNPLPINNYLNPFTSNIRLASPDPNEPNEDFTYYITLSTDIPIGKEISYQLVAFNNAGYTISDRAQVIGI